MTHLDRLFLNNFFKFTPTRKKSLIFKNNNSYYNGTSKLSILKHFTLSAKKYK